MKSSIVKLSSIAAAVMFLSFTVLELSAHARAGGSRSMGSRGSRSYSRPAASSPMPSQPRQAYTPGPGPFQPQAGGGFMRSMAGGLAGGVLGNMLFSSFAGAGNGAGTGAGNIAGNGVSSGPGNVVGNGAARGGIGLFEIILLAGGGFLLYRYLKKSNP